MEILEQLNAEGEGLAQGSQAVLRGLDQPDRILPAVPGALISLIDVEEEFILAIEAAFGRNLHAVILENQSLAVEIIAAVKGKKLGQTALIAPGNVENETLAEEMPADTLGWAVDKVHAPANLQALVRHLLGGIVLVRDLEQALSLKPKFPALSFVTRDGEVVSAKGVIFGGRLREESNSILARKAQIAALSTEHRKLLEQQTSLREKRNEIEHQAHASADRLEQLREQHQAARANHAETSSQTAAFEREWQEASRKFDALDWERSTLDQQLRASAERVKQLEHEATEQRKFLTQARTRQQELQSLVESERLRDDELADRLRELQLSVATERQRHEGLCTQRTANDRAPSGDRRVDRDPAFPDIANYEAPPGTASGGKHGCGKSNREAGQLFPTAEVAVEERVATQNKGQHRVDREIKRARVPICVLSRKELSDLHEGSRKRRSSADAGTVGRSKTWRNT